MCQLRAVSAIVRAKRGGHAGVVPSLAGRVLAEPAWATQRRQRARQLQAEAEIEHAAASGGEPRQAHAHACPLASSVVRQSGHVCEMEPVTQPQGHEHPLRDSNPQSSD